MARGNVNTTDYGAIWYVIDHRLGIRHSHLTEDALPDLARYNVLILPSRWGAGRDRDLDTIKNWVRHGGTLIALNQAVTPLLSETADFSKVRELSDVLGQLPDFELTILREWLGQQGLMPPSPAIWEFEPRALVSYPWQSAGAKHPEEAELKKRDAWQKRFMPQGAILAARVQTNHWLTFGRGNSLPLYAANQPVLMAGDNVEAPVRYGILEITNATAVLDLVNPSQPNDNAPSSTDTSDSKTANQTTDSRRIGWCALPPGTSLRLRMSGLLWPEASQRLANSAYLTRESFGRGQIILFAHSPAFRGSALGAERLLLNAIVYGPGMGTRLTVFP